MSCEIPPDHELVAFFEAEPVVLHPDTPWAYNTLDFRTLRGDIEVRCHIVSSYGDITTCLILSGREIAKFELRGAEALRLVVNQDQEALVVSFPQALRLDNFALQLKPRVWAAWGNRTF
ncbi:hypothetical protein [Labrys wisconsinensis]|uniref:Uncharacterized protein n=1 Tax=Labrys wisconsinensis TaxID=425677 RepID=A0ABU0JF37_9HYPH|nr:hypothetical protein [Labrys wisconsinensis]MDQ0472897.1 hypothetical protein [Labrys wisconsinensis]